MANPKNPPAETPITAPAADISIPLGIKKYAAPKPMISLPSASAISERAVGTIF